MAEQQMFEGRISHKLFPMYTCIDVSTSHNDIITFYDQYIKHYNYYYVLCTIDAILRKIH